MNGSNNPVMVKCNSCGAPAQYDILKQRYCCAYCGKKITVTTVLREKNGWKEAKKIRSVKDASMRGRCIYDCNGCGAKVVITEGEAMGECSFCGGKIVRRAYAESDDLPETVIPFVLNKEEAMACLNEWCDKNPKRPEAKIIQSRKKELTGYYLPYQLVKGQTEGDVCTSSASRHYDCRTYLDEIAINTSRQLPNDLLDAIEPFEWDKAQEFDFGMLAGVRVKLQDIDEKELAKRTSEELTSDFEDILKRKLSTNGIKAVVKLDSLLSLSAALPAYILDCGKVKMAINGQTGHVAVTKEMVNDKDYSILEPIIITLLLFLVPFIFFGFFFDGGNIIEGLKIGLGIMACFGIVTFVAYFQRGSETGKNVKTIFHTPPVKAVRENGKLSIIQVKEEKKKSSPIILERFKSTGITPVDAKVYPLGRILKWVMLLLLMNGLPVILALLVNGFHFERLEPTGSIVWWCLSIPVSFILFLKFVRETAFENPYFYYLEGDNKGKKVPQSEYPGKEKTNKKAAFIDVIKILICPPFIFVLLFALIGLLVCVMITAGKW